MRTRPEWLNRTIDFSKMRKTQKLLKGLNLNTVCNHALCPNISECYERNTATFLILGSKCTRDCRFCNVSSGPPENPEEDEPARIAEAVFRLKLKYVVITSVTRDDLLDGGAEHFSKTVTELRKRVPEIRIELLVPDFGGDEVSLDCVIDSAPDVLGHNIEMVPSLYYLRKGASYHRSLELLRRTKEKGVKRVKTGIMLGFGERDDEIKNCLKDIRETGTDYLSIGQYLQPSKESIVVADYVTPERFLEYGEYARELGFLHVESSPYVRSSYLADRYSG